MSIRTVLRYVTLGIILSTVTVSTFVLIGFTSSNRSTQPSNVCIDSKRLGVWREQSRFAVTSLQYQSTGLLGSGHESNMMDAAAQMSLGDTDIVNGALVTDFTLDMLRDYDQRLYGWPCSVFAVARWRPEQRPFDQRDMGFVCVWHTSTTAIFLHPSRLVVLIGMWGIVYMSIFTVASSYRRQLTASHRVCSRCRYDVRLLNGTRCPECGNDLESPTSA